MASNRVANRAVARSRGRIRGTAADQRDSAILGSSPVPDKASSVCVGTRWAVTDGVTSLCGGEVKPSEAVLDDQRGWPAVPRAVPSRARPAGTTLLRPHEQPVSVRASLIQYDADAVRLQLGRGYAQAFEIKACATEGVTAPPTLSSSRTRTAHSHGQVVHRTRGTRAPSAESGPSGVSRGRATSHSTRRVNLQHRLRPREPAADLLESPQGIVWRRLLYRDAAPGEDRDQPNADQRGQSNPRERRQSCRVPPDWCILASGGLLVVDERD